MAGTQGDDSFKSTASVMDNIGRALRCRRQNRKAVGSDDAFTTSDTTSQNVQNAGQSTVADQNKTFSAQDFAEGIQKEIESVVKDVMNMDEDTFTQTMAAMGITAIQLLQPEVLQQFVVLAGGGTDMTELLTSETLMDQFTQLTDALSDIDWNALIGS